MKCFMLNQHAVVGWPNTVIHPHEGLKHPLFKILADLLNWTNGKIYFITVDYAHVHRRPRSANQPT